MTTPTLYVLSTLQSHLLIQKHTHHSNHRIYLETSTKTTLNLSPLYLFLLWSGARIVLSILTSYLMIDSYLTAESSILRCISQDYTIFVHLFLISSLIQIPTNFELLRVIASREATTTSTSQTQAFVLSLLRYFLAFP